MSRPGDERTRRPARPTEYEQQQATGGVSFAASADLTIAKTAPASVPLDGDVRLRGDASTTPGPRRRATWWCPTYCRRAWNSSRRWPVSGPSPWSRQRGDVESRHGRGGRSGADAANQRARPRDAPATLVNSAASVTSSTADPNSANNHATWTIPLTALAGLTLDQDRQPRPGHRRGRT